MPIGRIVVAVLILIALAVYFRPLAVFGAARRAWLFAHGFRGRETRVGSWRIHYYTGGDGPPVVLIHGLASRADDWASFLPTLASHHRVYALDLLGYGSSDRPRSADYSIALETDVVRGFLDSLHIARTDLAGVSMGGWIALKLASEHPERVRKLVLIDSAGFNFPTTLTADSFTPHDVAEIQKLINLQTNRAPHIPAFVARDFLRVNREHAWILKAQFTSMLSRRDLMDGRVATVTMPTLLLWGTRDLLIPYSVAIRMQHELPNAQLVPLNGCGHLAIIDCKETAWPAIERFLM
ncbi:MAG TPA: alpha/beta fold hydrolase [Thermoanaerobaculia bacterium]